MSPDPSSVIISKQEGAGLETNVVAAAEIAGDLHTLLENYQRRKKQPNLTQVAIHGMPAGAGRKGGKLPRKKTKRKLTYEDSRIPLKASKNNQSASSASDNSYIDDSATSSSLWSDKEAAGVSQTLPYKVQTLLP
jgi:hypothetical protein